MPIPAAGETLGRSLLRDDVYRRLRDAIVDGTFAPGESLKDGDLAEWLGVSRTPVREALLRLSESGLIVAVPGRSTVVAELDPDAVRDARDVVAAMHELAARLAVPHLSPAQIARMKEANDAFGAAVDTGDAESAMRADDAFHDVLVQASGRPAIAAILDRYAPVVRRAELLRFVSVDRFTSLAGHARLIALCETGDVEAAAELAFHTWHSLAAGPDDTDAREAIPGR